MPGSHAVRRIACLQPSATVILDAVGELRQVVACTKYCADVVPEVGDLNTPAPALLQGLRALAFAIHPELFPCTKGIRQITAVPASPAENSRR
jgi:ABC-type Fe3+-hydroxamate transport system substrate-binding protein